MPRWTPDPSFYPSPRLAAKADPEALAYVVAFDGARGCPLTSRMWMREERGPDTTR